jgi:protease-4
MRWLRRLIVGFLAIVGLAALALVAFAFWIGSSYLGYLAPTERPVPGTAVLELDLTKALGQGQTSDPLAALFGESRLGLRQVEEALARAGSDPRVKGLVLRLGDAPLGTATVQELRDAVAAFRKHGKFALAFAESYGGGGSGNGSYYLAAACEEIWLQPSGEVGLTGLIAETPFVKGTLDKLGVVPRFDKREEYKTAIDQVTDAAYSPAFRESLDSILDSLYGQLTRGIAEGRGMTVDAVKALVDGGPYLARGALKAKLVDRLGYRDELRDTARRRAGKDGRLISLRDYFQATGGAPSEGRVIALIDGEGPIVSGDSEFDPSFGPARIGADTMARALTDAARAPDVAAILLRLDSPGGSYLASDTIWRAVGRAKAAGKPVIVSMGNVAASGGYFIAAPATRIVAEPGTLTGSIGVFGGKFVIKGLLDKLGITVDAIKLGKNAGLWSGTSDFTPEGWAKLEASLDAIYRDFTTKVAGGRGFDTSRIPVVAKGRVFTGEEAQKLGLVDALGGFPTALRLAREAAGLAPDAPVQLRSYPRPRRELRRLVSRFLSGDMRVETGFLARLGIGQAALGPFIAELPALLSPGEAWLLMPPLAVR